MSHQDPRKVFAQALLAIGQERPEVLAISCDSASGSGLGEFIAAFPDRFVEAGISEQNAIGMCAGLASSGYIPVVAAITPFITMRCFEQIRNDIGYANMNVKIVGSGGGLAYSTLGSSHQAIEDIALMRAVPNMVVLVPGDGFEVEMALKRSVEHNGPVYIRMPRHPLPDLATAERREFRIGKAAWLRTGEDLTIIAAGTMVNEVLNVADALRKRGIAAGVIDMPTIKPVDRGLLVKACQDSRLLVTVEEHSVHGGLGTAVAEILAPLPYKGSHYILGIDEGAVETGPYRELLATYSLGGDRLLDKICDLCSNLL